MSKKSCNHTCPLCERETEEIINEEHELDELINSFDEAINDWEDKGLRGGIYRCHLGISELAKYIRNKI